MTPTRAATATPTPMPVRYPAVQLREPQPHQVVQGDPVSFEWEETAALKDGDAYLVFLKK